MTLGERIKNLREEQRTSIRGLGRAVDVSAQHISNLEKGKVNASPELINKIAEALETDLDELQSLANLVDPEAIDVIQKNPQAVPSFLRSAKDLSPEEWEKMQAYLNRMKKQKGSKSAK